LSVFNVFIKQNKNLNKVVLLATLCTDDLVFIIITLYYLSLNCIINISALYWPTIWLEIGNSRWNKK